VIRTVTKHDERRAKVYLPVNWVGRKVRISLSKEEEGDIPEKSQTI